MSSPDNPDAPTVDGLLESLGLSQYTQAFRENNISPELFARLNDKDLGELGVTSLGHRKTILLAISKLQRTGRTAYIPPPGSSVPPIVPERPDDRPPLAAPVDSVMGTGLPLPVPDSLRRNAPRPPTSPIVVETFAEPKARPWWRPRLGGRFLYVSIIVHLLFALGATYLIVETIETKRKLTFQAGPKTPNPSQRSIEHKVSMAKKQTTMSAPAQPKRITTTGAAKVALPDMPSMPSMETFTPGKMAGMGGVGLAGFGGSGTIGGGVGGTGLTMFGFREAKPGGIKGDFYDLKQTRAGQPAPEADFFDVLSKFIASKYNPETLKEFYKAKNSLYATKFFIPTMQAEEGPKAFGLEKEVQPKAWFVHYSGSISPPQSGKYRFWGTGDDVMVVAINGTTVLDYTLDRQPSNWMPKDPAASRRRDDGRPSAGDWIELSDRETYRLDVIIGERPGGQFRAVLLLEQDGKKYDKDTDGSIIPAVFSTIPLNVKDLAEREKGPKVDAQAIIMAPKRPIAIGRP